MSDDPRNNNRGVKRFTSDRYEEGDGSYKRRKQDEGEFVRFGIGL